MIFIPGFLISALTFPGVIVHEAGHLLFCKLKKVAVLDVCFFRFGNPAGYVLHEEPKDFPSSFLIAVGPLIVNTLLCLFICFPVLVPLRAFGREDPFDYVLIWLGLSIGMHAFPSTHDAKNLWSNARIAVKEKSVLALLSFPLVVFIYVGNILSVVWFDLFYGVAVGWGIPSLIIKALA